jgi:hypothetical protein
VPIVSGGTYRVVNRASGKCVDASNSATVNGTVVQQYTCNNSTAQQWVFTATDGGNFQVGSRNATGQVWDIVGGTASTGDGVKVNLWGYVGGTNQQWRPTVVSGPYYQFVARHSAKCLDVSNATTADIQLQQWTCNQSAAQQFSVALVSAPPTPTARPTATATTRPRATATATTRPRATATTPAGCAIGAACQAETAALGGGVVTSTLHAGYTGSGFADYQGNGTGYVEWTVSVPTAGTYNLNIRYANGGTGDRPMAIAVNGTTVVSSLSFPVTGWTTWTVRTQSVSLPAGSVRIRATELPNGPNVDSLTVQ